MTSYLTSTGKTQFYDDGDLIQNMGWDMTYDGNNLDIGTFKNGDEVYMQLNNQEIMDLLNRPTSRKTLEQRLLHDFPSKKHSKKRKQTKKHKKSKSPKRRSHKKHTRKRSPKSKQNIQPTLDIEKTIY